MATIPPIPHGLSVMLSKWHRLWLETLRSVANTWDVKADRVTGAIENNFISFNASGNLKDSGKNDSDYADAIHNHDDRYYTESEIDSALALLGAFPSIVCVNNEVVCHENEVVTHG